MAKTTTTNVLRLNFSKKKRKKVHSKKKSSKSKNAKNYKKINVGQG